MLGEWAAQVGFFAFCHILTIVCAIFARLSTVFAVLCVIFIKNHTQNNTKHERNQKN
jgi:hypothetical protein